MRTVSRILAIALLVVAPIAGLVHAESSPEAQKWLEKLAGVYEKGPFKVNYSARMDMSHGDQTMGMDMKGNLTYADRRHMRMKLDMKMQMPQVEGPMEMGMMGVADGETMWMEMDNPMMGGKQVMKISLDKMVEMAASNPTIAFGGNPANMDPVAQIEQLTKLFDFQVGESSGGTVTLLAEMTEEMRSKIGGSLPPGIEMDKLTLTLDEKTGFPTEMTMGGEKPLFVMKFTDLQFVDEDSIHPSTFSYTPPDGSRIMDIGAAADAAAAKKAAEEQAESGE